MLKRLQQAVIEDRNVFEVLVDFLVARLDRLEVPVERREVAIRQQTPQASAFLFGLRICDSGYRRAGTDQRQRDKRGENRSTHDTWRSHVWLS